MCCVICRYKKEAAALEALWKPHESGVRAPVAAKMWIDMQWRHNETHDCSRFAWGEFLKRLKRMDEAFINDEDVPSEA